MTLRALASLALWAGLAGCQFARPISQTTITQLREQDAIVMAPELPIGMGPSIASGGSSLSAGVGLTAVQGLAGLDIGQTVIPMSGVLRGAAGASDGLELTASGSIGSVDVDLGPVVEPLPGVTGILGRGAIGLRMFVPFEQSLVEWGWSVDIGAEATHVSTTDTLTVSTRDRQGTTSSGNETRRHQIRSHPHLRMATLLRAPVAAGLPLTAFGGLQLQTWPSYWKSRIQTDVCTTYRGGEVDCVVDGSIDVNPSKLVAVFTPTAGVSVHAGNILIHAQAYANIGSDAVDAVPVGAMIVLERIVGND